MDGTSSVWKWLASMLMGVVLAGIPLFIVNASKVDAGEVRHIIQTESPYTEDKQLIFFKLDQTYSLLKEISGRLQVLQDEINTNSVLPPSGRIP